MPRYDIDAIGSQRAADRRDDIRDIDAVGIQDGAGDRDLMIGLPLDRHASVRLRGEALHGREYVVDGRANADVGIGHARFGMARAEAHELADGRLDVTSINVANDLTQLPLGALRSDRLAGRRPHRRTIIVVVVAVMIRGRSPRWQRRETQNENKDRPSRQRMPETQFLHNATPFPLANARPRYQTVPRAATANRSFASYALLPIH
jgi:hypothetical protein